MIKTKYLLIIPMWIGFTSCTHSVHLVHNSGFEPYQNLSEAKLITTKSEQFTVLGMVGETNYVDRAYDQLIALCPEGMISGITTQYSTSHGFLSWRNKIMMNGYCLSPGIPTSDKHSGDPLISKEKSP